MHMLCHSEQLCDQVTNYVLWCGNIGAQLNTSDFQSL